LETLSSTTPFPALSQVDKIIRGLEKAPKKTAEAKIAQMNAALHADSEPDLSFFTSELLSAMDTFTETLFKSCSLVIGLADDSYLSCLPAYVRGMCKIFDEHQQGHPQLQQIKGKLRWMFYECELRLGIPYPIMTEKAIEMVIGACKPLWLAIHNVSKFISLSNHHL
jgi:hypothetical protein